MGLDTCLHWEGLRRFLPFDLDQLAVDTGALARRRGVAGGEALVRTLCLMALPSATIEQAAKASREAGLASLGKTAMFKRLCGSEKFLEALFGQVLRFAWDHSEQFAGLNLVAVDATSLCGPGSKGTDQRLHVVYDLGARAPRSVEITGPEGGESLVRHSTFGPGDLVLGDRGYGHARGLLAALARGASILVRIEPFNNLRLFDASGKRLRLEAFESALGKNLHASLDVFLEGSGIPLRAMGTRNLEGKAVWLLTNLAKETLSAKEARSLYAKRWQVELFFKRLKSLAGLDQLPSRDGPTARAWIWAKLLVAAMTALASDERFSPWGLPQECLDNVSGWALADASDSANPATVPKSQKRTPERKAQKARKNTKAIHLVEA